MKIGYSFVDLAPGGAQQLLVQLASEVASQGHSIIYTIRANPGDPHHVDPYLHKSLMDIGELANSPLALCACQVIHLDGYHSLRHKIPFLLSMHKCIETYHSKYSVERSRPLYAPHRVAVSRYVQSYLPAPTGMIPNGIKMPLFSNIVEKEYDVAMLGRIHPVKNQDLYLNICGELFSKRQHLSCLIIGGFSGDRAYQEKILSLISALKSPKLNVEITGFIPHEQVFTWLAKSKILIIPSMDEGFGRMAIEAMACGLPVVSNPVGGLLEIIDHGVDGFFTETNQIQSFVHFANYLLDDPSLCQEMGTQGMKKVSTRYTLEKMASSYVELYRHIITESS